MWRNKIPLCAFMGFNIAAWGIFMMSVGILVFSETNLDYADFERQMAFVLPTLFGGILFISGIGLLLRKNWARIVLNIFLLITLMFFVIGGIVFISEFNAPQYWVTTFIQAILALFFFSSLIGVLLFLNNHQVVDELKGKELAQNN